MLKVFVPSFTVGHMSSLGSLFTSQAVLDALEAGDYGVLLRLARRARGLTQAQAGQLAGYSGATISRFETGTRRLADIQTLRRLAVAFDIAPELFGLAADVPESRTVNCAASLPSGPSLTTVVTARPQDGDEVRRRELLAGLTGLAGALALPLPKSAAGPDTNAVGNSLAAILTNRGATTGPASVPALRQALADAWQAFDTCHYQALAGQLPGLVEATGASHACAVGHSRQAFSSILADAYVLTSELALKANEDGIAWVAADRALSTARESGDPAAIAASSRAVAMAMRRQGHYTGATALLTGTAMDLDADHGTPPPRVLAAYGSLLCTAAYACAQNGQQSKASDLIAEARVAADRMGVTRAGRSTFSAANVEVYEIGIHTALGDSAGALNHARSVDQHSLLTSERHARFCVDTARAWQQHGQPDRAVQALLVAERQSPEEIRRPSVKALITTMIHTPGTQPPALRHLAQRTGTLA
jgi:transcriptional regulator with XRE-family HTH domain